MISVTQTRIITDKYPLLALLLAALLVLSVSSAPTVFADDVNEIDDDDDELDDEEDELDDDEGPPVIVCPVGGGF